MNSTEGALGTWLRIREVTGGGLVAIKTGAVVVKAHHS
jgi:hypothetical protein